MKLHYVVLAAWSLALVSFASQSGVISMNTMQGKWELSQLTSWNLKYPPKSNRAHFLFKGSPVKAAFNKTERVLTAPEVEGEARLDDKKNLVPEKIDFRGGVTGKDTRGTRTVEMSADSGELRGDGLKNDLDLVGNVRLAQTDSSQTSNLVATGSKATVTGAAKSGATGVLQGPVHLKLNGTSKDGNPLNVNASCQVLTFDLRNAPFRIVLQGDVVVTGAQPGYEGETRASKLTLLLDKDYQPIEMQGSGEPGTTTFNKGGGGH